MTAPAPILSVPLGLALVAALPRHADAALYANGTTSAQTLAFGAPFSGRAM